MYDSVAIKQDAGEATGRWLFLIHQIPPKPDYFRVKVRRRLHRIGAIALKNSVYVLPNSDDAMEDFQWLRRMVVEDGGEATLCAAAFIEGVNDEEMESMFRAQSNAEYTEIIAAARAAQAAPTDAGQRRLARQLDLARARDFFDADQAEIAVRSVCEVEDVLNSGSTAPLTTKSDGPHGATWVTRSGVFIDRIASAWLIRRFIDTQARFKFVSAKGYTSHPGEFRFDMFDGEYTHEGDNCTFEVLITRFALRDEALRAVADIVHDIDCKDEKFEREETAGVASLIRGIALTHDDDAVRIEAGTRLFDNLYSSLQKRGE